MPIADPISGCAGQVRFFTCVLTLIGESAYDMLSFFEVELTPR